MAGLAPASELDIWQVHCGCGKPYQPYDAFARWFIQRRWNPDGTENPFVPLRVFLAGYCTC